MTCRARHRLLLPAAALSAALTGPGARAAGGDEPLLPPAAFRTRPACAPIDPFVDLGPEQRGRRGDCRVDGDWRLAVRTPRVAPGHTGAGRVELDLDRQVGLRAPGFTALARVRVAAASHDDPWRLQPRHTLLAAHGRFRVAEQFSLDLGLGHDRLPEPRSRAVATATWHGDGRHLLYVQLAAEPDRSRVPSMGLRWWMRPGRASLDFGARATPHGPGVEPRLTLRVRGG